MSLYDQVESSPKEERRSLKRICIPALLAGRRFRRRAPRRLRRRQRQPAGRGRRSDPKGVESGKLEASIHVKSEGKKGGDVRASLDGQFQAGAKGSLPQLAMTAAAHGTANGKKVDFEGGLTVLSDRAFVGLRGNTYEVDPTTFGFIKSGFERAQQEEGKKTGDVTACQEAATGLQLSELVENPESEGGVDVAGTSTTKVSGELSAKGAADAVIELAEDPACKAQIELAGPLPLAELEKARGELARTVKKAHVEVYVGSDHIIRKVVAELTVEPPQAANERVEDRARSDALRSQRGTEDRSAVRRQAAGRPVPRTRGQPAGTARRRWRGRLRRPARTPHRRLFPGGGGSGGGCPRWVRRRRRRGEPAAGWKARRRQPAGIRRMPAGSRNAD